MEQIKPSASFHFFVVVLVSQKLQGSKKDDLANRDLLVMVGHLSEGNQLAEDEPDVNHFEVGGEGQLLHHTCEDCRHHQHVCQVNRQGSLEEEGLKEGGGKGDHHEQDGGQVGAHHLAHDLPPKHNGHTYSLRRCAYVAEI